MPSSTSFFLSWIFHPKAIVSCWRPFDSALSQGSDLAVLNFIGSAIAKTESWIKLEPKRPESGDRVFALEYLTSRGDGDLRTGEISDPQGDVISLKGDRFLEPGMSGTGLFFHAPGERLLGLISARPPQDHQTRGYAIPAEQIQSLISEFEISNSADHVDAPELATLIACAVNSTGNNARGLFEEFVEHAMAALCKPKELWREEDVAALLDIQVELDDISSFNADSSSEMPSWIAGVFGKIRSFCAEIGTLIGSEDKPVNVDDNMRKLLTEALSACGILLDDGPCPRSAVQALGQLRTLLKSSLDQGSIRLRQLSHRADLAERRAEGEFTLGARLLLAAIGQRPDLAPAGTIFLDSAAEWAPEMVVIPLPDEGHFQMGSMQSEPGRFEDETRFQASISKRFAIGDTL